GVVIPAGVLRHVPAEGVAVNIQRSVAGLAVVVAMAAITIAGNRRGTIADIVYLAGIEPCRIVAEFDQDRQHLVVTDAGKYGRFLGLGMPEYEQVPFIDSTIKVEVEADPVEFAAGHLAVLTGA